MDDPFEIDVFYKGQNLSFPAMLLRYGYSHKIQVEVNDQMILFEPDEERNYRAVLDVKAVEAGVNPDKGLLQAIATTIESILK